MQEINNAEGTLDAMKKPFAPIFPMLEQFSRQHRINLDFDTSDLRWGEARFQLFWLNAQGCSCYLRIFHREQDAFLFQIICWGIHSKLGEKIWDLVPSQRVGSVVLPLLQEALQWSDAFSQPAETP